MKVTGGIQGNEGQGSEMSEDEYGEEGEGTGKRQKLASGEERVSETMKEKADNTAKTVA